MKNRKIPSLIAIALLFAGTVAGTLLIQRNQSSSIEASAEAAPKEVLVTNVMSDSFTVSWTTDEPNIGFIVWGKGNNATTPALAAGNEAKTVHSVKVLGLEPNTEYSFAIKSGNETFNNGGSNWKVRTGTTLPSPDNATVLSGTVLNSTNSPLEDALVVVSAPGMAQLSSVTTSSGTWVIPVSLARNSDLTAYAEVGSNDISIEVVSSEGKATANADISTNTVLPPIVIGKAHDFGASIEEIEPEVKGLSSNNVVTLESVENGEVIFTNEPEFFGQGPAGKEISITVHSDPVSGIAEVENDGTWKWTPPTNLENGLHNITIEWIDLQGIVHTLTRSFIVQAQEDEPSFESTPSGNTSPSPTASSTPKPTATATPRPTATVKPTNTATAKPQQLPDAGNVMPTLLLATTGFVTLSLGAFLAIKK